MTSRPRRLARRTAALGAALATLAIPALAAAPVVLTAHVESMERGLICNPPAAGRRAAPDTVAGWVHVPDEPVRLIHHGSTAPAVLGMGFGVEFTLAGSDVTAMRYTVTHPAMAPDGRTEQAWDGFALAGEREAIFFQFDVEEELLPGRWAFTATANGEPAFSAAFDVVDPETVPHLTDLCRGAGLLSLARP